MVVASVSEAGRGGLAGKETRKPPLPSPGGRAVTEAAPALASLTPRSVPAQRGEARGPRCPPRKRRDRHRGMEVLWPRWPLLLLLSLLLRLLAG